MVICIFFIFNILRLAVAFLQLVFRQSQKCDFCNHRTCKKTVKIATFLPGITWHDICIIHCHHKSTPDVKVVIISNTYKKEGVMSQKKKEATVISPKEAFDRMKPLIMGVPDDRRTGITMPNGDFMQEGQRVVRLVEKYGERLCASDIAQELLDTIADRAAAFAYSVANLESYVEVVASNRDRFIELKKKGYISRRKLISDYEYIFRSTPELIMVLEKIKQGRGDLEMFKDLLSLHKISVDHEDRLVEAHFNFENSEKAYALYRELINLSAVIDTDPKQLTDAQLLVKKTAVVLWEAMEEIYAAGRYVFYDEPEIEELFYIDYYQKVATRRDYLQKSSETIPPEPEPVTQPEPELVD